MGIFADTIARGIASRNSGMQNAMQQMSLQSKLAEIQRINDLGDYYKNIDLGGLSNQPGGMVDPKLEILQRAAVADPMGAGLKFADAINAPFDHKKYTNEAVYLVQSGQQDKLQPHHYTALKMTDALDREQMNFRDTLVEKNKPLMGEIGLSDYNQSPGNVAQGSPFASSAYQMAPMAQAAPGDSALPAPVPMQARSPVSADQSIPAPIGEPPVKDYQAPAQATQAPAMAPQDPYAGLTPRWGDEQKALFESKLKVAEDQAIKQQEKNREKIEKTKEASDVEIVLKDLIKNYKQLYETGAMVESKRDPNANWIGQMAHTGENIRDSIAAKAPWMGEMIGSEASKYRGNINATRPRLMGVVKKVLNLTGTELNSEKELQFWLNAITNPDMDAETAATILEQLSRDWGDGTIRAKDMLGYTPPELLRKGDIVNNNVFMGGDPADRNSWKPIGDKK